MRCQHYFHHTGGSTSQYPSPQSSHNHHHHHHHSASSNPSAAPHSTSSGTCGVQMGTCCAPWATLGNTNQGSNTLPSSVAGLESNGFNCRSTRTLPNICFHPSEHYSQWGSLSTRSIVLFSLSLVFILIWSSVISGVLISHSLRENEDVRSTMDLFSLQQDIGQLIFQVGQEMLFSLNCSFTAIDLSINHNPNGEKYNDDSVKSNEHKMYCEEIQSKWKQTNESLTQLSFDLASKGLLDLMFDTQAHLYKVRSRCLPQIETLQTANQTASRFALYTLLAECVHTFHHNFHMLDSALLKDNQWLVERHSKISLTDLAIRAMPYNMFVRGLVHRFTTLGMGLILVRSNFSNAINVSEYFHYYHISRQLIESSFLWNNRFLHKYLELENTDYKSDLLVNYIETRRMQEHEFYTKMSSIFGQIFNLETIVRIRNQIKKKNVETVERLLVNGSKTKFVTDQEANQINIPLNEDLLELVSMREIEQMLHSHSQMVDSWNRLNLSQKYDQLLRNQIGFMSRVHDFLNISMSSHLAQDNLSEQQSLLYNTVLSLVLILSVLFGFILHMYYFCCHSARVGNASLPGTVVNKSGFGRRMRRRLWGASSFTSLLRSCFFLPSSTNSTASSARYPLMYKSSLPMHQYNANHSPHQQMSNKSNVSNVYVTCSSPNGALMCHSNKRVICGGIINRYLSPSSTVSNNLSQSGINSVKTSTTGRLDKTYANSSNKTMKENTALISTEQQHSTRRNGPSSSSSSRNAFTNSTGLCCFACHENAYSALGYDPEEPPQENCCKWSSNDERNNKKCSYCSDNGKNETVFTGGTKNCEKNANPNRVTVTKESFCTKSNEHSSTLSLDSDSKRSDKSINNNNNKDLIKEKDKTCKESDQ